MKLNRLPDNEIGFAGIKGLQDYLKMPSDGKEDAQQIFSRTVSEATAQDCERQALEWVIELLETTLLGWRSINLKSIETVNLVNQIKQLLQSLKDRLEEVKK